MLDYLKSLEWDVIVLDDRFTYSIIGFIFILLFVAMYNLFGSITFISATRRNIERLYTRLHERNESRIARNEELHQSSYDPDKNINPLQKLLMDVDDTIIYSEIKDKIKWMDTTVFIVSTLLFSSICFILVMSFIKSFMLSIAVFMLTLFVPYIGIKLMALKNYHRVEDQMVSFVDMISNNSAATNNLLTVLEVTAEYMEPPISTAIYRAITTANVTGHNKRAISQLTREIEYPLFVKFIRNLDICSRNDANYHKIAMDFSKQVDKDIKYMERTRAILAGGRVQIITLFLLAVVAVFFGCNAIGINTFELIEDMSYTPLGMLCLFIEMVLLGSTLIYLIIGLNK